MHSRHTHGDPARRTVLVFALVASLSAGLTSENENRAFTCFFLLNIFGIKVVSKRGVSVGCIYLGTFSTSQSLVCSLLGLGGQ